MAMSQIRETQSMMIKRPSREGKRKRFLLWLMAPSILFIFVLTLYPTIWLIYVSLTSYNLITHPTKSFIGLENFISFFQDQASLHSLFVTFEYVISTVVIELILGTAAAVAAFRLINTRKTRWIRTLLLIPLMVPSVVSGVTWSQLYNPGIGLISYLGSKIGMPTIGFLGSASTALPSLVVIDVWEWTPFIFLMILAGLESLPDEPFEAASIDGAGRFKSFINITIPLLKRTYIVALMIRVMFSFKTWTEIYTTTKGGPGNITETLNVHIFNTAFENNDFGYASALCIILLIIVNIVLVLFSKAIFSNKG